MSQNGDPILLDMDSKFESVKSFLKIGDEVKEIDPRDAKTLLDEQQSKVLLVDCRESEEQQVSMLPNAIIKSTFEQWLTKKIKDPQIDQVESVIIYCTIGARSGLYVKRIQQQMKDKTNPILKSIQFYNMNGSILKWYHYGFPLVLPSNGQETSAIHVYGSDWAIVAPEKAKNCVWFSPMKRKWIELRSLY